MSPSVDTSNPYESTAFATHGVQRPRRPLSKLSISRILQGLGLAALLFGIGFTACLMIFDVVSTYLVNVSPLGAPSGNQIAQAVGVISLFGVLATLPVVPLLLLANSKKRLGFRMALGIMMLLGTSGWVLITLTSVANYSVRPLGRLSPFMSELVTYACIIWIPSILAALAYAIWVNALQNWAAKRRGKGGRGKGVMLLI